MGLLDFDDEKIMAGRNLPTDRNWRDRRRFENNFEDLQLMGTKKQSLDFADSPFADRQFKADHECEKDMDGRCYVCKRQI